MKILLTGATGYIGQRLLPQLLREGHEVYCAVRDKRKFPDASTSERLHPIQVDLLKADSLERIPDEIDVAFYLVHSMSSSDGDFADLESRSAANFRDRLQKTQVRQVIYLSGIVNEEDLSDHLASRKKVEDMLSGASFSLTTLRASIIIGSGSASFEIIRDLVEKLPFMVAPRWLRTRSQPIAIRNVIEFLIGVIGREDTYDRSYDIGGQEILSYKNMLERFARNRGLRRWIGIVPVMTPKLSSYWLYFITTTSYDLAQTLVDSMKVEVICQPNDLAERLGITLVDYDTAIQKAFDRTEQTDVFADWQAWQNSGRLEKGDTSDVQVPVYGSFKDLRQGPVEDPERVCDKLWQIGGNNGWYYADWLWRFRGFLDWIFGGVGNRRGRPDPNELHSGDTLDFWRVMIANREEKRLLLFAEMKLPGDAWLEFRIADGVLTQTATFRPLGLMGRLYWLAVWPFHRLIFQGMMERIRRA